METIKDKELRLASAEQNASRFTDELLAYGRSDSLRPLFFQGDSLTVLRALPANSFDCCMTSYFLKYHPNGSKPSDVWDILPEDTQKREGNFAPYPEDLCKIPILATCPENGIVLDPFCGTGTTNLVAFQLGRKSVGIDLGAQYLKFARERSTFLI